MEISGKNCNFAAIMRYFNMSRKVRTGIWIAMGTLLVTAVGLYLGRSALLRYLVNRKIERIELQHNVSICYASLQMSSLHRIELKGFSIVPDQRDTLLKLNSLSIDLNCWKLLGMQIRVKQVQTEGLALTFVKKDSLSNYDFIFKKDTAVMATGMSQPDFSRKTSRILNLVFGLLPDNGEIQNVRISHRRDCTFTAVEIPDLTIKGSCFATGILVQEDSVKNTWMTRGELNKETRTIDAEIYRGKAGKIILPYIDKYYGAEVQFDTLACRVTETERGNGEITLNGVAKVTGLDIFHKALSPEVINLDRGCFDYRVTVGKDFMELDSTTTILLNQLQFHPYLRAQKTKEWRITASVNKPWFAAAQLFGSLPKGLFSNLDGLKTSGELAYHFLLDVDFSRLDSLVLQSELKEKNFRIIQYGAADLGKMSGEFSYTAYENGQPVRTFPVGSSWEHFTPLDSISPLLQMSVMQSEDGGFYYHQGFLPDALREALIYDLKVKRFARGGSTISMQLVKNVFLTRNKNIARKLEEALIVWLIETKRLTSKERMYEVYLNIAEWGPAIYGVREAAAFYFNKRPSQLTAEESIFLASIIPKPKHFRNSFTDDMQLKEHLEEYYQLIGKRLVIKGLMSETEAEQMQAKVEITGEARNVLSASKDSTGREENRAGPVE